MSKKLIFRSTTTPKAVEKITNSIKDIGFKLETLPNTAILTRDLETLDFEKAVQQSLQNILSLRIGGNVLFPENGAPIYDMLFNQAADLTTKQQSLYSFISIYEPRINITFLALAFEETLYNELIANIHLFYTLKDDDEIKEMNISISNNV